MDPFSRCHCVMLITYYVNTAFIAFRYPHREVLDKAAQVLIDKQMDNGDFPQVKSKLNTVCIQHFNNVTMKLGMTTVS